MHRRQFADTYWGVSQIAELSTARSRRLEQTWDNPATLTFTMDGRDPAAALIAEFETDVMAWRWDDQPGATNYSGTGCDAPVFRGIVAQAEDEVSEESHTVTFTCHDYAAMLARRYTTQPLTYTQVDQDTLVANFVAQAVNPMSASGQSFSPGGYLPLASVKVNPDGTQRLAAGGQLRDRTYPAASPLDQMLDDLAKSAPLAGAAPGGTGAFDYDVIPAQLAARYGYTYPPGNYRDNLRIFYPYQGLQRFDVPLVYGSTVAAFTRTVSSGDYANMWRAIGAAPSGSPDGTPPMFSEQWNSDSNNVTVNPIGLWMETDNAADVTIQSTLDQKALGDLALAGIITPSYTLTMRPGAYRWGAPNMGDVCPVIIQTGRLNVNTNIRVLGIAYSIGDDGEEDVEITVGRPSRTLTELTTQADRDADALTRR